MARVELADHPDGADRPDLRRVDVDRRLEYQLVGEDVALRRPGDRPGG